MFKNILVPLDGSPLAENVLPHTVALAQAFEARCTLLRVLETEQEGEQVQSVDALYWRIRTAETQAYLKKQADDLASIGLQADQVVLEGQAAERIIEFAQDNDVDLIVLSSHGRSGLSRWNVSGIVRKTVQSAGISTMITRAYQPVDARLTDLRYERLLLPLDGSQRAECVLSAVTTLTRYHEARLMVARVIVAPEMPRRAPLTREEMELTERVIELNRHAATHYLDQLESQLPIEFEPHLLVSDHVAARLHEFVMNQEIDLVVMSAHGYSGRRNWPYGCIATSFIEYGTTPLLIVQDMLPEEVEPTRAEVAAEEQKGH
jgi:nucleotide-binding universal stress UspA family protein